MGGEQGQLGKSRYDLARFIQPGSAVMTGPDMLAQRLHSEAAGLIQQKVDLVG
jgi:hypothetical protein